MPARHHVDRKLLRTRINPQISKLIYQPFLPLLSITLK